MPHTRDMNTDKMLGKKAQPFCGSKCCGVPPRVKAHKRAQKRRERQAMMRRIRLMY